jgi:hypothetical protein
MLIDVFEGRDMIGLRCRNGSVNARTIGSAAWRNLKRSEQKEWEQKELNNLLVEEVPFKSYDSWGFESTGINGFDGN